MLIEVICCYRTMTTHFRYPPEDVQEELRKIASAIVAPGKGILAADESPANIGKRLQAIGLDNKEETRRQYRQILFSTENLADNISAVILHDETCLLYTSRCV